MDERPTLRAMGVGDIVDAVLTLVRSRPLPFVLIAAVPQLVFAVAARAIGLTDTGSLERLTDLAGPDAVGRGAPAFSPEDLASVVVLGLALTAVAIVAFTVQAGALVDATARRYLGEDFTVGSALGAALRAAPRLIGAGVLAFLGVMLLFVAAFAAFFTLAFVAARAAGVLGALIGIVGVFAVFAALFYVSASWLVAPVVVMREGAGPVSALRRSWWLSHGSRWRILGLLMLLLVLQVVIGALFSLLFLAAFAADPTASTLLQEAANLLAAVVVGPLQWGTFTLLYYDLRVRREAYDLRLAAEALPRGA